MGRGDEIKTLAKLKLAAHDAFFPAEKLCWQSGWLLCWKLVDKDDLEHYVKNCKKVRGWFQELGKNVDKITEKLKDDLDKVKGSIHYESYGKKKKK
ncbi:hypothetical protein ALC60_10922 [Trachymyrmex zeteki]|nr:hypothetical protein ALC60_10922 [Trachymyrmex zeteki]